MKILSEQIIYTLSPIGLIIVIILGIIIATSFIITFESNNVKSFIIGIIGIVILLILGLYDSDSYSTLLNKPDKIKCIVEVTDENAYKNIITNYKIKEKPYDNKEIYIIEKNYEESSNE